MSALPVYVTLGIEQPSLKVLEWYLACVRPQSYDAIRQDLTSGREIINPIEAFERIIRNNQPIPAYKTGLEYANNCFPRSEAMAKEAARWMLRWEPELTKTIGRTLRGEQTIDSHVGWPLEKHIAYALMSTQMMATNWEHRSFVESWNRRLSYRTDMTTERRQVAAAKAYWTQMGTVHPEWTSIVWEGTLARTNPKYRESLEVALAESHRQLTERTSNAMPGLPEMPTRTLVGSSRPDRSTAVPAQ